MTRPTPPALASPFHDPFPGHLPDYLAENQRTSPGKPDPETYNRFLVKRWRALLDSEDSHDESLRQGFLERHPSLPSGSRSVDGDSGHSQFPVAVIAKEQLDLLASNQTPMSHRRASSAPAVLSGSDSEFR